jgi:GTP cyclohydrolase IIa
MSTQVTLIQIDNYGPWTTTPHPRREMDLQTLQSRLFADLAQFVGNHDGYVFFTRFDNMVAVTNGLDYEAHTQLQASVRNRYPVSVSFGVGVDDVPLTALERATERLQAVGSAQEEERTEVLTGEFVAESTPDDVEIAHFDVNGATEKYTDQLNEFDSFIQIERGYASLMEYMRDEYGGLSFFVGGDNVIAACPALDPSAYRAAVEHVRADADVELKVGVGRGRSAHEAGYAAKHALEECRHNETTVELDAAELPAD